MEALARVVGLAPAPAPGWVADVAPAPGRAPGLPGSLRPLDLAPDPDGAARRHLDPAVVEADLDRLASGQQEDGGWTVDFVSRSPMGKLDWRGFATVAAVDVLRRNGRG
ncbi:MAG TPA: hypothetical protein VFN44_06390 [Solirubrobacteraceae bacterium]|nr:hypothetical protein [Solirubrobacteraceae bacterium]